jgi:hypothetical protein
VYLHAKGRECAPQETLINPEFAKPDLDRHRGMNCKTSPRHSASPFRVIPREVAESRRRMDSATSRGMTMVCFSIPGRNGSGLFPNSGPQWQWFVSQFRSAMTAKGGFSKIRFNRYFPGGVSSPQ